MRNRALLQGRFQPVNIGHAATLSAILQEWNQVTIGVVYNSPRPLGVDGRFDEYLVKVEAKSYAPHKMPFSVVEIRSMWQAYIEASRIADRVTCMLVKRLEYELEFVRKFPPSDIDLVWPELNPDDHETDVLRHHLYRSVLNRPIYTVRPAMKLHNAQIRELIVSGKGWWDKLVPRGAYEVFLAIDGPSRMAVAFGDGQVRLT